MRLFAGGKSRGGFRATKHGPGGPDRTEGDHDDQDGGGEGLFEFYAHLSLFPMSEHLVFGKYVWTIHRSLVIPTSKEESMLKYFLKYFRYQLSEL